ncbi:MAG: MarR family winged helix-turn-helix transcriptional regulator [Candidatus Hermodarchaeota archaeon]
MKIEKLTEGGFLITKIQQLSQRIFDTLLKEYEIEEITAAQGRVIFPIWQKDNLSFQELKKATLLSKATLSYMLDQLEKGGHIQRIRSQDDKRVIYIKLTKLNKDLMEKFIQVSKGMKDIFYKGFSDNQIATFEENLKKVLDNLTDYKKKD